MAEIFQGLDPGKLVLGGAVLSFAMTPFTEPVYNLPIFLFGTLVHESNEAPQSFKLFTGILSASILFDIIWVFNNEQNFFARLLFFLLWFLKARAVEYYPLLITSRDHTLANFPTAMTFLTALRQRDSQFMGISSDISGPTVWSMPGGFTSSGREGYQVVDDEPVSRGPAPPPPQKPTIAAPTPKPASNIHPSNYQSA